MKVNEHRADTFTLTRTQTPEKGAKGCIVPNPYAAMLTSFKLKKKTEDALCTTHWGEHPHTLRKYDLLTVPFLWFLSSEKWMVGTRGVREH
jgi:hypothetical protein